MLRDLVDEKHTLAEVALLVRRAGMEHCFSFNHPDELQAMAEAGDYLETRRAAYTALAFSNPAGAMAQFDNGLLLKAQARAQTKALAYEVSERGNAARD